jgi:hypothetical protein
MTTVPPVETKDVLAVQMVYPGTLLSPGQIFPVSHDFYPIKLPEDPDMMGADYDEGDEEHNRGIANRVTIDPLAYHRIWCLPIEPVYHAKSWLSKHDGVRHFSVLIQYPVHTKTPKIMTSVDEENHEVSFLFRLDPRDFDPKEAEAFCYELSKKGVKDNEMACVMAMKGVGIAMILDSIGDTWGKMTLDLPPYFVDRHPIYEYLKQSTGKKTTTCVAFVEFVESQTEHNPFVNMVDPYE